MVRYSPDHSSSPLRLSHTSVSLTQLHNILIPSQVYPQYAYPIRHNIISTWASALMSIFIPILIFLLMQFRIRSFWDVNNAVLGLLYSLLTAAVFQVFIKWLIGGLRPHFLEVCQPAVPTFGTQTGRGFGNIMYDRKICTGNKRAINDALESMPSGHTTAAFAGFVFLYLYLNAKLKVWSNFRPAYWKLVAIYAPILGAVLIGGSLTIDAFHNWYDILAGAIIGTMMAFSAYRMMYASVWDFRFNHIPLARRSPFTYSVAPSAVDGFHDAMWTRKAGWGTQEGGAWGGAPFDATEGSHGSTSIVPVANTGLGNTVGSGGVGTHLGHGNNDGVFGGASTADRYDGQARQRGISPPIVGRGDQMV